MQICHGYASTPADARLLACSGPAGGEDEETMTSADLKVEVRDQDIIVTMPETSFRVVYRKPNHRGSQLVARLDYFKHDQKGPITRARLEARQRQGARAGVDRVSFG